MTEPASHAALRAQAAERAMADEVLDVLATERRLQDAEQLDQLSTREQVALFAREDARAVAAVEAAGDALAAAVDIAVARIRRGGRLIEIGAGTPGRLAYLDVAECRPTFGVGRDEVVAVVAGGADAAVEAVERGEDDQQAGRADLLALAPTAADVVIGISASGRTPYVLAALATARDVGAATIAVTSNEDSPLAADADVAIETLTGPEIVSGSTRLKAGTAQKLVLNTISTLTMVQVGHTFGDLMVDVRATNDKLRRRAHRVVVQATGADDGAVAAALAAAEGHAKVAIVSLLAGVDVDVARARLDAAGGRARDAIAASREGA